MPTDLIEIARELAAANPGATADDISETIVNVIESEESLRIILGTMSLPGRLDLLSARMKKKRSRSAEASRIENRLQLIALADRAKSRLNIDVHSSSSLPLPINGNRVAPKSFGNQLVDGNSKLHRRESVIAISKRDTSVPSMRSFDDHYLDLPREREEHGHVQRIVSLGTLVDDISRHVVAGDLLLIDDIAKILLVLEHSHDRSDSAKLLKILQSDIEARNKVFNVDCLRDLYEGDDALPEGQRTRRPDRRSIKHRINERIRAILVHEQRRLHRRASMDFLEGRIAYRDYVESSRRYAIDVGRLYPAEP